MPTDNVLRCRIPVKLDGLTFDQILDVITDLETYLVVLQWGESEGAMKPRLYVPIPSSEFKVIEALDSPYELTSETVIDLDSRTTQDVEESPGEGWRVLF